MRMLPKVLAPLALLLLLHGQGGAAVRAVPAGGQALARALESAQPGDTLALAQGTHRAGGLALPDGIRLIGQGERTRITGRSGQPLFRIEGAYTGVGLENLLLEGARSRESGGAILAHESAVTLRGITVRDCRSRSAGGAVFARGGRLEILDCRFLDNRATRGGAVALERGAVEDPSGRLEAANVLFAGNRAERGGALHATVPVRLAGATLVDNQVLGPHAGGSALWVADSLDLLLCTLTGNRGGPADSGPVALDPAAVASVHRSNLYGNTAGQWQAGLAPFAGRNGNLCCDPGFVDARRGDYRLLWDSPLRDAGPAQGLPQDFDLTPLDIGYRPTVPLVALSGIVSADLPAWDYEITDHCRLEGTLAPGATFRLAPGKHLQVRTPARRGRAVIGSARGPRTAFVGQTPGNPPGASIVFLPGPDPQAVLAPEGVLFNHAPLLNGGSGLVFASHDLDNPLPLDLDGRRIRFQNYSPDPARVQPAQGAAGNPVDGSLLLWNCRGRVSHLEIGTRDGQQPARLLLGNSTLELAHSRFPAPGQRLQPPLTPLASHGTGAVGPLWMHDCELAGSWRQALPLLELNHGAARLEHNRFHELGSVALVASHASLDLGRQAGNAFLSTERDMFRSGQPLIQLECGDLRMEHGANALVLSDFMMDQPMVAFWPAANDTLPERLWSGNFWGMGCHTPIGEWDLVPGYGMVPPWACVTGSLDSCRAGTAAFLPLRPETPQTAHGRRDGRAAAPGWGLDPASAATILTRQPASRDATLATLVLKALPGSPGSTETDPWHTLRHGAEQSAAADLPDQALFQQCSVLCAAAARGDRRALATLDEGLTREQDPFARETLERSLHEAACAYLASRLAGQPDTLDTTLHGRWLDALHSLFRVTRETRRTPRPPAPPTSAPNPELTP